MFTICKKKTKNINIQRKVGAITIAQGDYLIWIYNFLCHLNDQLTSGLEANKLHKQINNKGQWGKHEFFEQWTNPR